MASACLGCLKGGEHNEPTLAELRSSLTPDEFATTEVITVLNANFAREQGVYLYWNRRRHWPEPKISVKVKGYDEIFVRSWLGTLGAISDALIKADEKAYTEAQARVVAERAAEAGRQQQPTVVAVPAHLSPSKRRDNPWIVTIVGGLILAGIVAVVDPLRDWVVGLLKGARHDGRAHHLGGGSSGGLTAGPGGPLNRSKAARAIFLASSASAWTWRRVTLCANTGS